MVKGKWIGIILIVAAGVMAAIFLFPGEEKKVKKQFSLFANYFSKDDQEKILAMAGKMKNLESLFAETCEVHARPYSLEGNFSRADLIGLATRARMHFADLYLKFHDFSISFPDQETAQVALTGEVKGKNADGSSVQEVRELECFLKKQDGRWLFRKWEIVEVLTR